MIKILSTKISPEPPGKWCLNNDIRLKYHKIHLISPYLRTEPESTTKEHWSKYFVTVKLIQSVPLLGLKNDAPHPKGFKQIFIKGMRLSGEDKKSNKDSKSTCYVYRATVPLDVLIENITKPPWFWSKKFRN